MVARSLRLMAMSAPLIGWRGRVFFSSFGIRSTPRHRRTGGCPGGVAAGGVDEDRFVGEPPVAVARAADAADGVLAELVGEREAEAGVDERRRFPRTRRPDEDVPGQLVEILAVRALAELGALEQRQRIFEPLLEDADLFLLRGRQVRRLGIDGGGLADAVHQLIVGLLRAEQGHDVPDAPDDENDQNDDQPDDLAVERPHVADGDERPHEPHDQSQNDGADQVTNQRAVRTERIALNMVAIGLV
jgi:hypothetical protein